MIYVDEPREATTPLKYKIWSHMWSDTSAEELHEMASKLGLKREWYQEKAHAHTPVYMLLFFNHYDVVPSKRDLAIELGAQEIDTVEYYKLIKSRAYK